MRPDLKAEDIVHRASALLDQPVQAWRQAAFGADHLVIFATLDTGEQVVLKAGLDADVDAAVLQHLHAGGVPVPRLLALTRLTAGSADHSLAVMSFVDGTLLADIQETPHRYLPQLVGELRKVHAVTSPA